MKKGKILLGEKYAPTRGRPGKSPIKTLYRVGLIAGLVLAPLIQSFSTPGAAGYVSCTYIIPERVVEVDGTKEYVKVKPGDTLCLQPGIRPNIKFMNLHGTEQKPITIRNAGGTTIITGRLFLTGGIGIVNSTHLRITGTGESARCGAGYTREGQRCGIEIVRTHKGIKLDTSKGIVENIEIDHISIHDIRELAENLETRGITIHPKEHQLVSGLYVHHNYVSGTSAEGIYLGAEPRKRPFEVLGKLENVDISYNLVQNTGFDGIKLKVAIRNVKVHHNVVLHTGLSNTPAHQGGIKVAKSIGDFYSNYVQTDYEGIRLGRPLDKAQTRFYNNVVVGAERVGIESLEETAQIFNNTVISSGEVGINAPGVGARVFDNIVVGTSGVPIKGFVANVSGNYVGTVESAHFVNPETADFRLQASSPAVDAGGFVGSYPEFDYFGVPRPQGRRTDLGAYEYPWSNRDQLR